MEERYAIQDALAGLRVLREEVSNNGKPGETVLWLSLNDMIADSVAD